MSTALVIDARPGWTDEVLTMLPGAHAAVMVDEAAADTVGIEGRLAGLELRDTVLVLRSGPRVGFVFIFRKPIAESTVTAQILETGTGGLNIDACRVRRHTAAQRCRWPSNVVIVHAPECTVDFESGFRPELSCAPLCAALLMDRSSGELRCSTGVGRGAGGQHGRFHPLPAQPDALLGYGDTGGASRACPQFGDEGEMRLWLSHLVGSKELHSDGELDAEVSYTIGVRGS